MNALTKWIGGSSLVALGVIGVLMFAGNSLGAQASEDELDGWLSAEDVLAEDPAAIDLSLDQQIIVDPNVLASNVAGDVSPAQTAFTSEPVVQETPVYDADNPFVIKRILPIDGPIRYGEWHWDDEGVPDGPLVVTVDLQARVISVFRDGYEIGAAAALLGTPDHPTPLGTFPILSKERHNVSEKYGNAPMPWTLRLTWDGVAIHGGSTVELGYASHGCIGVPDEFVSRLYAIARTGDVVIITDGQSANIGTSLASS